MVKYLWGDFMKKLSFAIIVISIIFLFTSCRQQETTEDLYVDFDEEYSSVLALDNISNADKNNMIHQLAQKQIERAERYRILIKDEYTNILNEYKEIGMSENSNMTYEKMCKSLDEYFDSLKNEFDNNIDFFEKQAYAQYGGGTATAAYLSGKQYECAKAYADKAQAIYEELR